MSDAGGCSRSLVNGGSAASVGGKGWLSAATPPVIVVRRLSRTSGKVRRRKLMV
jgi:hypothetical protein